MTDACCREHDNCGDTIEATQTKYGLTNSAFYTRWTLRWKKYVFFWRRSVFPLVPVLSSLPSGILDRTIVDFKICKIENTLERFKKGLSILNAFASTVNLREQKTSTLLKGLDIIGNTVEKSITYITFTARETYRLINRSSDKNNVFFRFFFCFFFCFYFVFSVYVQSITVTFVRVARTEIRTRIDKHGNIDINASRIEFYIVERVALERRKEKTGNVNSRVLAFRFCCRIDVRIQCSTEL